MEEFELYYARLELCAYTYLLDRLSEKKNQSWFFEGSDSIWGFYSSY